MMREWTEAARACSDEYLLKRSKEAGVDEEAQKELRVDLSLHIEEELSRRFFLRKFIRKHRATAESEFLAGCFWGCFAYCDLFDRIPYRLLRFCLFLASRILVSCRFGGGRDCRELVVAE